MEAFESTEQFCGVESSSVDVKSLLFLKMMKQLAAVDERQNEVKLLWRLERELQRYNERIINLSQYRAFSQSMRNF